MRARELGPSVEQRQRAFDLRRPDEADRARAAARVRFSAISFESVRATSRIVAQPLALSLAPGRGMIEMTAEDDLLAPPRVGAGDRGGGDVVGARLLPGAHDRVQADRLARRAAAAASARARLERDHEREGRAVGANVSRCPQRTRFSSSPHQAVRWFCA